VKAAEVVIVGAGVIGASVAWHLASRGCRDVLLLDRAAEAGAGSTRHATGGFRAQFATDVNVRLSLLSRQKLLRFQADTGADPGYERSGYLLLASDSVQLEALRAAQTVQRAAGLAEAREVTPADIREINPAVSLDGIVGGTFCPSDGFIRPLAMLGGYLHSARRLGMRVATGVDVTRLTASAVETTQGTITATHVVNAAGAWAGRLSAIPVTPLKRQVAATVPTAALSALMPMTVFLRDGFHLRCRDGRVLLLLPHAIAPSFDTTFDPSWLDGIVERAHACVPALRSVPIDRAACWAGLYEMSPDKHVLLGRHDGVWIAAGASGHGVMHAPALGELLAQMILGEPTTIDVTALRPSRFTEGQPNPTDGLL
jgi:sarcosine oxidase subunit beta